MGEFADRMGTKNPGDLILSSDWNQVVKEIDTINGNVSQVETRADANRTAIEQLETRMEKAETELQSMLSAINTLRGRFRQVTLNTERSRFAFGETGIITAQVSAIDGSAIDFSETARPWIDFVTVWGSLSAADGFASLGGEGGRTISVQVNEQGIARVQIRAESASNATEEEESSANGVMQTVNDNGLTFAQIILSANTPQDTSLQNSYSTINHIYDNNPGRHFTRYVDRYYRKKALQPRPEVSIADWYFNDHRTTVMALVKGDNNPVTAEPSLGTAAIQITFRDWIYPWIILGYMPAYTGLVDEYTEIMQAAFTETYSQTSSNMKARVYDTVKDKGWIGMQRDLNAFEEALSRVSAGDSHASMQNVAKHVKESIRVQKEINMSHGSSLETFSILTDIDARNTGRMEDIRNETTGVVEQEMQKAKAEIINDVKSQQQEFRDEIFSETAPVSLPALQRRIQALDTEVSGLVSLDPEAVTANLDKVSGIEHRLMVLENRG